MVKLLLHFRSLDDWSEPSRAEELVDLLQQRNLWIEKVDDKEPIRQPFDKPTALRLWRGIGGTGRHFSAYFLFRGKGPGPFTGMVVWNRDLPVGSTLFNTINVWLNVRDSADPEYIIGLGDDLFVWSRAVSGLITPESLYQPLRRPAPLRRYLPGLFWVNYFGELYTRDESFDIPLVGVALPSGGTRLQLGTHFSDTRLTDAGYLDAMKESIGRGWFAEGLPEHYRLPELEFSRLWRE